MSDAVSLHRGFMVASDDPRTDQQLIAAINAGSVEAFETLYRRYRDWTVNLAMRFTGNRDDALDVMQQTFSYVLSKFPGFELTCRFTTFLYPAVRHTAIALRKKRRREPTLDEQAMPEPHWAPNPADERLDDLSAVLSGLGEAHREVVLLRFVENLSIEEIAEAMAIPPGTVKSRLHHALAKLRADPRVQEYFEAD